MSSKWDGLDAEFARHVNALVKLGLPSLPPHCGRYRIGALEVKRVWDGSVKRRAPKHPMAACWFITHSATARMGIRVATVADTKDEAGGVRIEYRVSSALRTESETFWLMDDWASTRWLGVTLRRSEKLPAAVKPLIERFRRVFTDQEEAQRPIGTAQRASQHALS